MISTFINAWKVAELRKKLLFTALIVLIFRIGAAIPVPFTNIADSGIVDPNGETFMMRLSALLMRVWYVMLWLILGRASRKLTLSCCAVR